MTMTDTTSAQIDVRVEGTPLNPMVAAKLISAEVDTTVFVPSQFRLVFRAPSTQVLEPGGLQLGVMVMLQVTTGGAPTPLMTGDITGVEVEYGPEGHLTIVTGLDRSHRLMRGTKTMAYPQMSASDVVTQIVAEAGLMTGEVIPTSTQYEWVTQPNVSPWVFIQQLAALENCVAYVDPMGLFQFGPMNKPEEGLPPVMSYAEPPQGTQLVLGKNLIRLRCNVTSSEQVPAVTVTGYNPKQAMPVVGLFPSAPSTSQSLDPGTLPPALAGEVGALPFFDASRPFDDQGAAEKRAESIAADIAGALAEMEGECLGNPAILAGEVISLGMVGPPFDGQYVCTAARHRFEPGNGGYSTWFTVGGMRDRSMLALASGSGGVSDLTGNGRVPGVAIGIVTDNMDPESQGRVKVMFPWLSEAYVSAWARTMQIGAGKAGGYGCLFIPEVGDEVLVGFDRGHVDSPYVIGNLYNGVSKPQPAPSIEGGVANRRIMSRMRHMIEFDDGPDKLGITIVDGEQTLTIKLDSQQQTITINSEGQINIQAQGALSLKATADIGIESEGNVSIKGTGGVSVQSPASLSMEGAGGVKVEGSNVSVSAPQISLGA
ncbi:MAG TPA: VgrG-related protein [Acidimicrobiales bacterium]|nr:VgrG-related protein [Acidimicrobiales bacterium]